MGKKVLKDRVSVSGNTVLFMDQYEPVETFRNPPQKAPAPVNRNISTSFEWLDNLGLHQDLTELKQYFWTLKKLGGKIAVGKRKVLLVGPQLNIPMAVEKLLALSNHQKQALLALLFQPDS
jgi:hypothetical protein